MTELWELEKEIYAQGYKLICGVDGETVTCLSDISNLLLNYSPGDTIELTLYRRSEKKELTITVTLLEDKGETQSVN